MRKTSIVFLCVLVLFLSHGFTRQYVAVAKEDQHDFASAYCVVETKSGRVLQEGNKDKRLPMASTTKILTAILVIENTQNLDELVEIPAEAVGIEGSSIYLKKGEHLSVRELLLGLMIKSGNDAAVALAVHSFGSLENYQKAANKFVENLGLKNTNIVTPNGLHDDKHFTSAFDLAVISTYAMKNNIFREIVGTQKTTISNEFGKGRRVIKNKNKMLADYNGATGIKTGFTKKAGRCLVSSAERNGMELVCVVLNCQNWFKESERLLNESFATYKLVELVPEHFHVGSAKVLDGNKKTVNLVATKGFCYPLDSRELSNIQIETKIKDNIVAPISRGDVLGEILVYNKNNLIFSEKVYSIEEVESTKIKDIIKKIWLNF